MPLPGPTEKKKHWQNIVLTPLVTPGTYNNACVTVNQYGLVTGISSCPTAAFIVVDVPANLPNTGTNGDLAVVLDDSSGGDPDSPEAMYVWDADAAGGKPFPAPYYNWRRIASTADLNNRIDYRQGGIATAMNQSIGAPLVLANNPVVKEVSVTIINPYDPGTRIQVRDTGATVYMDSGLGPPYTGDLDPMVPGTYTLDASGNQTVMATAQLEVLITGAPVAGTGYVFVKVAQS